jgi:hypothetical protein
MHDINVVDCPCLSYMAVEALNLRGSSAETAEPCEYGGLDPTYASRGISGRTIVDTPTGHSNLCITDYFLSTQRGIHRKFLSSKKIFPLYTVARDPPMIRLCFVHCWFNQGVARLAQAPSPGKTIAHFSAQYSIARTGRDSSMCLSYDPLFVRAVGQCSAVFTPCSSMEFTFYMTLSTITV